MLQQTIRSRGGIHRSVRLRHAGVVVPNRTIDTTSWSQYFICATWYYRWYTWCFDYEYSYVHLIYFVNSNWRHYRILCDFGIECSIVPSMAHPCCCVCCIIHFLCLWSQCYQGGMRSSQSSKSIAATRETLLVSAIAVTIGPRSVSVCRVPYSVSIPSSRGSNQS